MGRPDSSDEVCLSERLTNRRLISSRPTTWGMYLAAILGFACTGVWGSIDYERTIKPLLKGRCYACHGALKQEGELRLDTADAIRKGGESGPALVPGQPDRSLILERVVSKDETEAMPPKHEGERLNADQVASLREWVREGADGMKDEKPEMNPREHWAFRARQRPSVPSVAAGMEVGNPVDAFIGSRLAAEGLRPAPEAPREVLVRRLYFDLLGVPPDREALESAMASHDSDWYERLVDRLLEDPRHGERWGRHWMDIWRYSDWWGLGAQLRNSQKNIWHFRDWLVESLNADRPYDEMVRMMLAADEIAPKDPSQLRATGFLARNWFLFNRNTWMEDTVEHVGKGLLGLTMNCTKCHDHKYDPISQADFYRMRAIFEPYHVRMDVVPDQTDPERGGIPRAFDGVTVPPTYRFVRGEESNPDKSREIEAGVPKFFAPQGLAIEPVRLPVEASEPERQPWVLDAHLKLASEAVAKSQEALKKAEETLAKAVEQEKAVAAEPSRKDERAAEAKREASESAVESVRLSCRVAEAELESVRSRAAAMRSGWAGDEIGAAVLRKQAIRAERAVLVARAQQTLSQKKMVMLKAVADKRAAAEKEVKTAEDALAKARQTLDAEPKEGDRFTPLHGSKWTPTRFLSSGKDDPEVKFPQVSTGRRKALAEWITDSANPLTARVAVNHLWGRHFGAHLAGTPFDFGRSGNVPVHSELLDWLACELVDHGWSMKHVHRLICGSAAYRRSSSVLGMDAEVHKDPDVKLLWRRTPVRLEAEALRDAMLSLSGVMDWTRGGPSVMASEQAASRRRSLYFYHSNNDRNLFLTTFDGPMVKECYRREQSVVPQQALAMSNSALATESSKAIAGLVTEVLRGRGEDSDRSFVEEAFLYVTGIKAGAEEVEVSLRGFADWERALGSTKDRLAVRSQFVWVLLNHNDFVTLR